MPVQGNLRRQAQTVLEWLPIVPLMTALGDSAPGVPRVMAAVQILRFVTSKTAMQEDDRLVLLIEAIVLTEQGRALIDYLADQIQKLTRKANVTV
jgi:hypothetical protein